MLLLVLVLVLLLLVVTLLSMMQNNGQATRGKGGRGRTSHSLEGRGVGDVLRQEEVGCWPSNGGSDRCDDHSLSDPHLQVSSVNADDV